jgi:hypothetical protein
VTNSLNQSTLQGTDTEGKTYFAEILSLLSVELERHLEPRLLARIRKFTVVSVYLQLYPLVDLTDEGTTTFVGVEEIRMPVGLSPRSKKGGEEEVWGIVTNPRAPGTRRVCIEADDFV